MRFLSDFSGGHTDRDGMREGSGNVADVVSKINDYKTVKEKCCTICDHDCQKDKTSDEHEAKFF